MSAPPIGTVFKNLLGTLNRVREHVEFAGHDYLLVECIDHQKSTTVKAKQVGAFVSWEIATDADWSAALEASKAEGKTRAEVARRREDAERWGIKVKTWNCWETACADVLIVRSTKTTLVDVNGNKWSRRTGNKSGQGSHGPRLELDVAAAFLDNRDVVDIVAERKAAEESDK